MALGNYFLFSAPSRNGTRYYSIMLSTALKKSRCVAFMASGSRGGGALWAICRPHVVVRSDVNLLRVHSAYVRRLQWPRQGESTQRRGSVGSAACWLWGKIDSAPTRTHAAHGGRGGRGEGPHIQSKDAVCLKEWPFLFSG